MVAGCSLLVRGGQHFGSIGCSIMPRHTLPPSSIGIVCRPSCSQAPRTACRLCLRVWQRLWPAAAWMRWPRQRPRLQQRPRRPCRRRPRLAAALVACCSAWASPAEQRRGATVRQPAARQPPAGGQACLPSRTPLGLDTCCGPRLQVWHWCQVGSPLRSFVFPGLAVPTLPLCCAHVAPAERVVHPAVRGCRCGSH